MKEAAEAQKRQGSGERFGHLTDISSNMFCENDGSGCLNLRPIFQKGELRDEIKGDGWSGCALCNKWFCHKKSCQSYGLKHMINCLDKCKKRGEV